MKIVFLALLLLANAQRPGPCYQLLFEEGRTACDQKKYDTAIKKWEGGLLCPDAGRNERALLRQWIDFAKEKKKGAANTAPPKRRDFVEKVLTPTGPGQIDWSNQFVEAEGVAVIDRKRYANAAQARAVAIRGAEIVGYANLLEIAKGVRVQRTTTVRDLMTESDVVRTEVEGIVRGARRVGEPEEKDDVIYVQVRMPLYQLSTLSIRTTGIGAYPETPALRPEPVGWLLPPPPGDSLALLLRFNDSRFDPALAPVIADETGTVLFDLSGLIAPPGGAPAAPPDWNGPKLEARAIQRADGTVHLPDNTGEVLEYLRKRAETGGKMQPVVAFLTE